jgi:tetratricopeptide (TPR) repeat protein
VKLTVSCVLVVALCALPLTAQQSQNDALISRADKLVKQGDYAGALGVAQQAIRLNDSDFRGYYYAAFSLFKQNLLSQAEPFVDRALALAPAANKPDVEELVNAIRNTGSYQTELQQADQAMQNGQTAIAAEAYTKAWEARRSDQKTGLKAAKLWGDRLNAFGKANQILQYIVDHPSDPDTLAEAQQLLNQYRPAQSNNYNQRLNAGSQAIVSGQWGEAKRAFEDAVTANPDGHLAHLNLARVYAHENNDVSAIAELRAAARDANASSTAVMSFLTEQNRSDFGHLFGNEQFVQSVRDGFGTAAAERLEQLHADDAAKKSRLNAQIQGENAKWRGTWVPVTSPWSSGYSFEMVQGSITITEGANQQLQASGSIFYFAKHLKDKYDSRQGTAQVIGIGPGESRHFVGGKTLRGTFETLYGHIKGSTLAHDWSAERDVRATTCSSDVKDGDSILSAGGSADSGWMYLRCNPNDESSDLTAIWLKKIR